MSIKKKNPDTVAQPVGAYAHLTVVPRDADILVLAGQVGNDINGELPARVEDQFRLALLNIRNILESEDVDPSNIFKINLWFTDDIDRTFFNEEWSQFFNGAPPSTTFAFVKALAHPDIKIEVEAWAAKK